MSIELKPVFRGPSMEGPQVEYHFLREVEVDDNTGEIIRAIARHPIAYRILPSEDWIDDPELVDIMFSELFYRDAVYAKVQEVLGPMFVDSTGVSCGAQRIDNNNIVHLILPADKQPDKWLEAAVAVSNAAPEEVQAGAIAIEWVP